MLVANQNSIATLPAMSAAKQLEQWQIDDATRLAELFRAKAMSSQADFGAEFGIGTQGMVWQYLNARRPLNIAVAVNFASGLSTRIDDFSPTIADQIRKAYALTGNAPVGDWPFVDIKPDEFRQLPERLKGRAEERVRAVIEDWAERDIKSRAAS